jgi:hypothetical protein
MIILASLMIINYHKSLFQRYLGYFIIILITANNISQTYSRTWLLSDQSKAIYSTKIAKGFNLLIFEKNGLQYILNINKKVSDQVSNEILVEVANTVDSTVVHND